MRLPLRVRTAAVRRTGDHLAGYATIADVGRRRVRPTVGWLSVRRVAGGELLGVARLPVAGVRVDVARTVRFGVALTDPSLLAAPGKYAVLVCLDAESQIQRFVAKRNCTVVGKITIASGADPSGSPPSTTITRGPFGVRSGSSVAFRFATTTAPSSFQCRLDGGPWVPCRSPQHYAALVSGPHSFEVRAMSVTGSTDLNPARASWTVRARRRSASLAATPYMGWNTYYGVGGVFDEQTIISVANSLLDRGLASAGYRIVWLDFGWASGQRDSNGRLLVDPHQWPHGLRWLTGWLHKHGLLAGIYTDAGYTGCHGQGVGSRDHYQQDANTFAAWGFDAVKVDFCGAGQEGLTPQAPYAQFASALRNNSSHRPMLLNVCNFWVPGQINGTQPSYADSSYANYQWAPQIAQSWRTDTDIGFTRSILFTNVLRNLDHDAAHPDAAGPGHWNDPDYLGPELGMTSSEAQAQLSMWAIVSAPLMLGSDPRMLSSTTINMLKNQPVIAIDQDPLGIQGAPISQMGSGQVWVKPLLGGARAVALLNRGSSAVRITTNARAIGLPPATAYTLRNLWAHTTTTTTGVISAVVPGDSAVLYRVTTS